MVIFMRKKKKIKFIVITFILILVGIFLIDPTEIYDDFSDYSKIEIYDNNNEIIFSSINDFTYLSTKISDISSDYINILLHLEDKNFYKHSGFDIYRITKSLFHNLKNDTSFGASTITQQYIKNAYLTNEKTFFRKIKELYLSIKLENEKSKNEILELYLNTLSFGNHYTGIKSAAYGYFNKDISTINLNEFVTLIAILKAPSKYNPILNYNNCMEKKDQLLNVLYNDGIISTNDFEDNYNKVVPISLFEEYSSSVLFYKDVVLSEFKSINVNRKFEGIYKIYTNFDTKMNLEIEKEYRNINTDYSVIATDENYYLTCAIGGKNYYENSYNLGIYGKRDIASTIKPFLYYEALEAGMTPLNKFLSSKTTLNIDNEIYSFSNYNDQYLDIPITMGHALATSDNIYAIKTHVYIGMNKLKNFLNGFNIEANAIPSLGLGSVGMSLLKLNEIYQTFAHLGNYEKIKTIKAVALNGEYKYIHKINPIAKLDSDTCYVINELMTYMFDTNLNTKISVTGSSIANKLKGKIAGKSGLSDFDAYMIGLTPKKVISVWVGYSNNDPLIDVNEKALAKKIFLTAFNSSYIETEWFIKPKRVMYTYASVNSLDDAYKKYVPYLI